MSLVATLELIGESFTLEHPTSRCIVTPHRNNNVAAAVAETIWMLAGRSDIAYLRPYLPRAADFSDDGITWRGAYGPRLRHHFGVDQLDQVRRLLLEDPATRRAVLSLFDPGVDYGPSKDVPCNNWLQFLSVNDRLDLSITARSLDIMWGFSGIDAFAWSVLHELMASWVGLPVGRQHWFVGSCHLYDHHRERAERILADAEARPAYPRSVAYQGEWDLLDSDFRAWFEVEKQLRAGQNLPCSRIAELIEEPLLQSFGVVVAGYWDLQNDRPIDGRMTWLAGTEWADALRHLASWS